MYFCRLHLPTEILNSVSTVVCCVLVSESCPTLCDPMDCSPPGSSVHGILQARSSVKYCQVGRIGKRSPKWRWLKDKEGKTREYRTKEGPRTGVRTSGEKNNTPGWPSLQRTGPGREKHVNRGAKAC